MGSRKIKYLEINDELGKDWEIKKSESKLWWAITSNILEIKFRRSYYNFTNFSSYERRTLIYPSKTIVCGYNVVSVSFTCTLRTPVTSTLPPDGWNDTDHSERHLPFLLKKKGASYCTSLGAQLSGKGYQKSTTENNNLVCWFLMINWSAKQKKLPEDGKTFTPLPHLR